MIETDAQTARHEHFMSAEASILGTLFFCTNILNTFAIWQKLSCFVLSQKQHTSPR